MSSDSNSKTALSSQRPQSVSRSISAPASQQSQQQSQQNQHHPQQTLDMDEDEVLAHATACALQAQQELAKTNNKIKSPFLFAAIESVKSPNSNLLGGGDAKNKLPLGDLQQRKLIEKKLGHALNEHQHQHQDPSQLGVSKDSSGVGNTSSDGNTNSVPPPNANTLFMKNVKDVKEKFENLFPQSKDSNSNNSNNNKQQNQQHQNDSNNAPTATMTLSSGDSSNATNIVKSAFATVIRSSSPPQNDHIMTVASNTSIATTGDISTTTNSSNTNAKTDYTNNSLDINAIKRSTSPVETVPQAPNTNLMNNNNSNSNNSNNAKPPAPTLSSIVWKRRNGYGKFSMNSWEKREINLVGTKIMYYKQRNNGKHATATTAGVGDQENNSNSNSNSNKLDETKSLDQQLHPSSSELNTPSVLSPSATPDTTLTTPVVIQDQSNIEIPSLSFMKNATADTTSTTTTPPVTSSSTKPPTKKEQKTEFSQFWEQTKQKINNSINELAINTSLSNNNNEDDPRGSIDLSKETVSVAAISDHEKSLTSVSPTPYGLCIMIKGENKWKLCFESHGEQIKWLTFLTEIIVQKSVSSYNQEVLKSRNLAVENDSVIGGGTGSGNSNIGGTISSGGPVLENFRPAPKKEDGMWGLDEKYSSRNLAVFDEEPEGDSEHDGSIEDEEKGDGLDENKIASVSAPSTTLIQPRTAQNENERMVENLVISDLHPPLEELILKGAKSGPEWYVKGHNLSFVIGLVNISLLWIYLFPMYWILFPFFIILINAMILIVTMELMEQDTTQEKSTDDNKMLSRREGLTMMKSSLKIVSESIGRMLNSKKNIEEPKATSADKNDSDDTDSIDIAEKSPIKVSFANSKKPIAGTTTKRIIEESESHLVNGHKFAAWSSHPPQDVQVRSHGYLKTKKKIPSPNSLYEVFNVEIFDSDKRVPEMVSKVTLPKIDFDDDDINGEVRWKAPDIFVTSLAIPTEEPSFTRSTDDGYGLNVTIYYKMKKETRDILKRITAPGYNHANDSSEADIDVQKRLTNGVRLWEEWCKKAPSDSDWQARFKFIPNVLNPAEAGLPSWISKYCGKPVLIKRKGKTGFLSVHPEINALEFDISLHVFPYLTKKAMAYLNANVFKKSIISFSYVVESRSDDELPEILIGDAVKLHRPNPIVDAIKADDFFAGTAPKSIKTD